MNLLKIAQTFATEDQALDYLVSARWPKGVRCLACEHDKVYRIDTRGKTQKPCRLYECADCGLHFSATTGTLFHDSHLPLTKWFAAMALMTEAKKGISANQVSRHIGVTYKTAWYLCHRIRKAMEESFFIPLGSPSTVVEIDETFIGGKSRGKGCKAAREAKIPVLGIAERGGRVHLQRVDNTKAETMRPVLQKRVWPDTKKFVTDAAPVYDALIPAKKHEAVSHKDELLEQGFISSTACVESAFSLFKRGVIGSYHKMTLDHLDSYLTEFSWRFNRRHMQQEMFDALLREVASKKPLTYKKLTREVF